LAPDASLGGNFSIDLLGEYYSTTTVYGYIKKPNTHIKLLVLFKTFKFLDFWWYLNKSGALWRMVILDYDYPQSCQ